MLIRRMFDPPAPGAIFVLEYYRIQMKLAPESFYAEKNL